MRVYVVWVADEQGRVERRRMSEVAPLVALASRGLVVQLLDVVAVCSVCVTVSLADARAFVLVDCGADVKARVFGSVEVLSLC